MFWSCSRNHTVESVKTVSKDKKTTKASCQQLLNPICRVAKKQLSENLVAALLTPSAPFPIPCNKWESNWNPECNQTIPVNPFPAFPVPCTEMEKKWNPQCNKTINPPFLRKPFPVPCTEMEKKWNPQCNKTIDPPFLALRKPFPVPCNEMEKK